MDFFLKENNGFTPFSMQHLLVLLFFICFGAILIIYTKKQKERTQTKIGNILAFSIFFTVLLGTVLNMFKDDFNYQEDLPLHLCSLLAILIPSLSLTKKFLYFEIYFFLILAGTFQSIITPDEYNYLNFSFFRYWFVHAGLIIFMLFAVFIYKMRPTIRSVWKSFLAMQVYLLFTYVVNYFLGSNYFYTNRKPKAATLLDFFGEWPQYIFVVELLTIPFFLLIYAPFYFTRKKN
jgi:hypothetical integral membrane protein (TIGR02206 family)|tara:strand:+ start:3261 stop:3962 length:702 start_codon:yes stop_codon:yes gene_type:complete